MTHLSPQSLHCIQCGGAGGGFLYYMLCSFPCYCSVPFLRHQNTAAAEASRGPPLTQTLNAVWYQQSSAEDNRKPNTARIMLHTQTQAKSANTLPCSCFETSSPHDTTVNAALRLRHRAPSNLTVWDVWKPGHPVTQVTPDQKLWTSFRSSFL